MEKKPLYESPKVSRLDEKETLHGQTLTGCDDGSGANWLCENGNSAGIEIDGASMTACVTGSNPLDANPT